MTLEIVADTEEAFSEHALSTKSASSATMPANLKFSPCLSSKPSRPDTRIPAGALNGGQFMETGATGSVDDRPCANSVRLKGYPGLHAPTPQSGCLALVQVSAETPGVGQGTWFDTCPGRGANRNKGLGES